MKSRQQKAPPLGKQMQNGIGDKDDEGLIEPMELFSQCLNTRILSLTIIAIAGSEVPIDEFKIMEVAKRELQRVNSCFSSIVAKDNITGAQSWKRVKVRIEDHVIVPNYFPSGLNPDAYSELLKGYLSKISLDQLSDEKPLWELHLFKYPTNDAQGTLIFKMHHALGDGFSIMGAVLSCFKRADDPSLPLSFPSASGSSSKRSSCRRDHNGENRFLKRMLQVVSGFWNTIADFGSNVLRSTVQEDDRTVIRSTTPRVEFRPCEIATVTVSLDDVGRVKSKINVSVNDVVLGIVFLGTELYSKALKQGSEQMRRTAMVLLNTRMLSGYRSVEDMVKNDLWGNNFSFIHLPLPSSTNYVNVDEPLNFIFEANKIVNRNKNSLAVFLNGTLLRLLGHMKGAEALSQYIWTTLKNTSMAITNIIGPVEKMAVAEHPISHIYFTVTGSPQSLLFTVMSYSGKLMIAVQTEKGFIDSQLLVSCLKDAFKKISEAASRADE